MGFVLEKITEKEQEKILTDLSHDQKKIGYLRMRGGHFNNSPGLHWAVDKENNMYLFLAPKLDVMSQIRQYYFFLNGRIYLLTLDSITSNRIQIEECAGEDEISSNVKAYIKAAFQVYGLSGNGKGSSNIELSGE